MSLFDFQLPFPANLAGGPVNFTWPRGSTPGPIPTDPLDLLIWLPSGAHLQAIASGALRYVPSNSGASPGALAIECHYLCGPWAGLVNSYDGLISDHVPAIIYYENVSRASLEPTIRDLIQARCGANPPQPVDTMLDSFFAGQWIGMPISSPEGATLVKPLILKAGTDLGPSSPGPNTPPDAATPNEVALKLRQTDNTTAIDIIDIALASAVVCSAAGDWNSLFTAKQLASPIPISTETLIGQALLSYSLAGTQLDYLDGLLKSDQTQFAIDSATFDEFIQITTVIQQHLSVAATLYEALKGEFAPSCTISDQAQFDLETVTYMIQLLFAYRALAQMYCYVKTDLAIREQPPWFNTGWNWDVTNELTLLNQTLSALEKNNNNPSWSGRAGISQTVDGAYLIIEQLQVTPEQLKMLQAYQFAFGAVMFIQGVVDLAAGLAGLAADIANGGGWGTMTFAGPAMALANGGIRVLSEAEALELINAGILIGGVGGTTVLMAVQGKFNPNGKTSAAGQKWVNDNRPDLTINPTENGRGWRAVNDATGIEEIRYIRPRGRPNTPLGRAQLVWEKVKKGYWRLQNSEGLFMNAENRVVVWQDENGQWRALNGAIRPRADTPVQVALSADGNTLADGTAIFKAENQDWASWYAHIANSEP